MNPKPLLLAACILLCCGSLKAQFAPDSIQGVMVHSTITSTTIPNGGSLIGLTTVAITAQTGSTYDNYALGNDEILLTNLNYSYQKISSNVGALTVWDPTLGEYVTSTYTFTGYDKGTVYSASSIGVVRGTFKAWVLWDWSDQEAYWDQATEAQNSYILANPSVLGLYNQAQLNAAVTQAKVGLYTQAQLDQAIVVAKFGLYTQAQLDQAIVVAKTGLYTQDQLDTAVASATLPDGYFKTDEGWVKSESAGVFTWKLQRSTDLSNWDTVGEAEVAFSGGEPSEFIKIEVE